MGEKEEFTFLRFTKKNPFERVYLSFTSKNRKLNIFMPTEKFHIKAVLVVKISILTKMMKYFQKVCSVYIKLDEFNL